MDNGGQWTHREWRVLKYLKVDTKIIPNTTPADDIDADGLVLSGGTPRIGSDELKLGSTGELLDSLDIPILGICAGFQMMILHHGGNVGPAEVPEYGQVEVVVDDEDHILKGVEKRFIAWESHNDEVKSLPEGFVKLAHSENTPFQAVRHTSRPLFGLQFHPEVEHTQHGETMFRNFVELCK